MRLTLTRWSLASSYIRAMRVLMATRGSSGHIGPLAPFGHACMRAGHEVLVSAQRQHQGNVERAGLACAPVDDPPDHEWKPLLGQFAQMDVASAHELVVAEFFAGIDVRAALPGLGATVESWRPDVMVRESWEFASTLVAEQHGIPLARVGLGTAAVEAESIDLAATALDGFRADLGLPPDPAGDRLRDSPYLTMVPEPLEDPAVSAPVHTHRFRALAPEAAPSLTDWWPGNDDPLVYLSLGSVAAQPHLPYFPALYRATIEALAPLPVRVLVTVGNDGDPRELDPLPANAHVESWVPQEVVAAGAAAIVCHGGYGSTLGALAYGVPLVVLPLFSADQWANAEAVDRAGAGIALGGEGTGRRVFDLPDADAIGRLPGAVQRLLADAGYRTQARGIAEAIRALPLVDGAVDVLSAS